MALAWHARLPRANSLPLLQHALAHGPPRHHQQPVEVLGGDAGRVVLPHVDKVFLHRLWTTRRENHSMKNKTPRTISSDHSSSSSSHLGHFIRDAVVQLSGHTQVDAELFELRRVRAAQVLLLLLRVAGAELRLQADLAVRLRTETKHWHCATERPTSISTLASS